MSFSFKPIEDVIDPILIPEFDICSGQSGTFCMMRLQCKGNIVADIDHGPRTTDICHYDLCLNAVEKAVGNNVDILITPEYSIPIKLVTEILNNISLQPRSRKVFCLSCEAIKIDEFRCLISSWEELGVYVVKDSLENTVCERMFVNVLLYLFKLNDNKLCIVPQLKTQHMADPFLKCEAAGLSLGSTIYIFGHNKTNCFCSIICADCLNGEIHRQQFQSAR